MHIVEIEFGDGSPSFRVLTVRDGITRVVSSWAAIYPAASPAELADLMVAGSPEQDDQSRSRPLTETIERARGGGAWRGDRRFCLEGSLRGGHASAEPRPRTPSASARPLFCRRRSPCQRRAVR